MSSQRNLRYILMKDASQASQDVMSVINFLNSQNITYLNPQNIVDSNFPDEINNVVPSLYLTDYRRYLIGEKAVLIFLAYHSNLNHNYITLKAAAKEKAQTK